MKSAVHVSGDVVVKGGPTFFICDDCGEAYLAPPYYTFDPESCKTEVTVKFTQQHENCTGNLCPSCSDMLEPDDPDDPRKQELYLVPDPAGGRPSLHSRGVR